MWAKDSNLFSLKQYKKNFERLNEKSCVFMFDENTSEDEIVDFLNIHEFSI